MFWLYAAVFAVLVGAGGYGVHAYNSALTEKEQAEGRAKEFEAAYTNLAAALPRIQDAANAESRLAESRGRRAQAAENLAGILEEELNRVKQTNSDVATWADQPVPPAIRVLLDVPPAEPAPAVPRPNGQPGGDPEPSMLDLRERGSRVVSAENPNRPAAVQR